ncbi:MAG: hypothetical protein KGM42_06740 [Hyphomicrobiales bacterium]|nr:hypothetical protein [Hyphomicrobiales bacterium]
MREILTIVAACLVAVLAAALVVPPFVDWDGQRARLEARLAQDLDATVSLDGPISVRLLPAPRLTAGGLSVERPGLALASRAAVFELSPTALLRGRFDFTEASLDRAEVAAAPAAFERVAARGARIGLEHLNLTDATLRLVGDRPFVVEHVDVSAAADTLAGPFRGSGVRHGAREIDFAFSTGAADDGRLRGKLALEDAADKARAEFDGDLSLDVDTLRFKGVGQASGILAAQGPPWRARFALEASSVAARATDVDARIGDEDHALAATGEANLVSDGLSGVALDARLASRNLDLDKFLRAYPAAGRKDTLSVLASSGLKSSISLSVDSATLGGETLSALGLGVAIGKRGPAVGLQIEADLPARSHLKYAGVVIAGDTLGLDGEASGSTREPAALGGWIRQAAPDLGRLIASLPFSRVEAAAKIKSANGALDADIHEGRFDRSQFSGTARWTPAQGASRAKLAATLASPALDIDGLPDLASLRGFAGDDDLALALDAKAIRIAHFGAAPVDAGRIELKVSRDTGGLTLDDLRIADLGGATLTVAGRANGSDAKFDMRIDAQRLADLAKLVRRIAPGAASDALASRAPALSPAHLAVALVAKNGAPSVLDVSGTAGGTALSAQLHPADDGRARFSARASSTESAQLLRQVGFSVLPLKGQGAASIEASGEGAPGEKMQMRAQANIVGAKIEFDGAVNFDFARASAEGKLAFVAADATPLVQLFGFGAGDISRRAPVQGAARVSATRDALALHDIAATVAGAKLSGGISRNADGALGGALSFDALSAPFLASLVVGPRQPAPSGALWPKLKFAPTLFDIPRAEIDVKAARLDFGAVEGSDARAHLSLAAGALHASDVFMRVGEGSIVGDLSLRRQGPSAVLSAHLKPQGVRMSSGPFSTWASADVSFSGAGASLSDLVGSLAGQGHARFDRTIIAQAAPDAVSGAIAAADRQGNVQDAALARSLAAALDTGPQTLDSFESDATIAGGRILLPQGQAVAEGGVAQIGGDFDLRTGAVDLRETLTTKSPANWDQPSPSVDLAWSGPIGAPRRSVQADRLVAALTERAIAREAARNAALEADIRERAFFNRRLKFDRRLEADRKAAAEAEMLREQEAARAEKDKADKDRAEKDRAEKERLERARSEQARGAVAPDAAPPLQNPAARAPAAFAPAHSGAAPDPSTAGRY